MIYPMFAIRDVKTNFLPPQLGQNDEDAIRQFAMMVNNPSGVMGFQPKDFDLYCVGFFDTMKGEVESVLPPRFVVSGPSLVENEK